jgi:hypothetical protein
MLNRDLDQHLQAESLYERALDICKQTLDLIHPDVSTNLSDMAHGMCNEIPLLDEVALGRLRSLSNFQRSAFVSS